MSAIEIIPTLRYEDAPKAIEWLCSTWGFKKHQIVEGEDNIIVNSQLTLGNVMIMVSSKVDSEFNKNLSLPKDNSFKNTQCPYIVVDNADWFCEKAKAAGAKILMDIQDQEYGGRDFTCADPEGYIWSFGTYNPRNTK